MGKYQFAPISPDRLDWVFSGDMAMDAKRGTIVHLRGDFGRSGEEFWCSLFDHQPALKTDAFRVEFNDIVNWLRSRGRMLHDYRTMYKLCGDGRPCGDRSEEYAFEAETSRWRYCLRLIARRGDYNFYLYAYDKASGAA